MNVKKPPTYLLTHALSHSSNSSFTLNYNKRIILYVPSFQNQIRKWERYRKLPFSLTCELKKKVSHIRYYKWLPADTYWNTALKMKYAARIREYFKTVWMSKIHHMEENNASPLTIRQV